MLVGVALSAPVAGRVAVRLDGRRLLRTAAGVEMALRGGLAVLVLSGAPVLLLALCITAMNVSAWTGYAGMRAEVAAVRPGAAALTWYGTAIAAVEAAGVALAAFLPDGPAVEDVVLSAVVVAYVLALVPTVLVAGGSRVRRAAPAARNRSEEGAVGTGRPRRAADAARLRSDSAVRGPVRAGARPHGRGSRGGRLRRRFAAGRSRRIGAAAAARGRRGSATSSQRRAWRPAGWSRRCRSRSSAPHNCCPASA